MGADSVKNFNTEESLVSLEGAGKVGKALSCVLYHLVRVGLYVYVFIEVLVIKVEVGLSLESLFSRHQRFFRHLLKEVLILLSLVVLLRTDLNKVFNIAKLDHLILFLLVNSGAYPDCFVIACKDNQELGYGCLNFEGECFKLGVPKSLYILESSFRLENGVLELSNNRAGRDGTNCLKHDLDGIMRNGAYPFVVRLELLYE